MNMGQVLAQVRAAVADPERVFLANRVDGKLITPADIKQVLRVLQGRGV
jgi:2-oxoglutarate ferredoxin oxidoreductase subunit alpha